MEDEKIIELYLSRSEEAIPKTEEKFGKLCVSIAKNILGNEEDAKECLNDTLLALWNFSRQSAAVFGCAFAVTALRLLAAKFRWSLPKAKEDFE